MKDCGPEEFASALDAIPMGESRMVYNNRTWAVAKTAFAGGRSMKLVAVATNGDGHVSVNIYRLSDGTPVIKPCEMPMETVVNFVLGAEIQ